MLLYVYRLSPAPTSVQMSCSVSRSDIIVKSWEFRRNHKPPCSVYIRCRGVNGYVLAFTPVSRVRRHIGSFEAAEFTHSQVHRNCYGPRAGLPSFRGRLHSSLRRRGRPQSASNMTTWINSQFPRPDFHRQVQRHYGLQDTEIPRNSQTSDTAVWGRSPDISEWRDVVLESTEVAPDGQRLPYVQMNKPPVRRDRDRPYIAFETQSDQFPPRLSSLSPTPPEAS